MWVNVWYVPPSSLFPRTVYISVWSIFETFSFAYIGVVLLSLDIRLQLKQKKYACYSIIYFFVIRKLDLVFHSKKKSRIKIRAFFFGHFLFKKGPKSYQFQCHIHVYWIIFLTLNTCTCNWKTKIYTFYTWLTFYHRTYLLNNRIDNSTLATKEMPAIVPSAAITPSFLSDFDSCVTNGLLTYFLSRLFSQ